MIPKSIALLLTLALCAACAPPQPVATPSARPPEADTQDETATAPPPAPGPTEPAITQTPAIVIATAPVYVPFTIRNTVENTVLRAGPSALFTAKTALAANTELVVVGISPGREWAFVVTPIDSTGWVFTGLLEPSPQLETAPVIQPANLQVVTGRVLDINGAPVPGIQYAIIEGEGGTGSPPRIDAVTDMEGVFHAFLPVEAAGTWTVGFTAVTCTSPKMGPDCQCPSQGCGRSVPESTTITLPVEEMLEFMWE